MELLSSNGYTSVRGVGCSGFYSISVRRSGETGGLITYTTVSGVIGNTTNRTVRGVGVVFKLSRGANLMVIPPTFWK